MALVTRKERNDRRMDALLKMEKGWGVGQTINYLVHDYKITRRSANLDVNWASTRLVQNLKSHERSDLLAWLLYQSQQVFLKSMETGNYSSACGALNLIHKMGIESGDKRIANSPKTYHGNYRG
tara:strand:+ start:194 stop:565 length:372 start_codon:yes stop_codon:yes gene_type:complete